MVHSIKNMLIHFCVIFSCIGLVFSEPPNSDLKLELVQVLFRHGARTPLPGELELLNNLNESLYEPWGIAQLTEEGMNNEYEIGKMLRERYNDFLPNQYQPKHVYAYSSDTARTKASLGLVLAALYPPVGELQWNDNLNWMPIPIHSSPYKLDILVNPRICTTFKEEFDKHIASKEVVDALSSYDQIFKTLNEVYGKSLSLDEVFRWHNLSKIHKKLNLTLPNGYTDELFDKIKELSMLYLDLLSSTDTLKKLNGGSLIKRFLENIHNLNDPGYQKKIYLYSAHDKNVHTFVQSHNITEKKLPDYGAAAILETHKDSNNKLYIKLLYWNGVPKELKTLKLSDCSEMCPFETYSDTVKSILPSEDEMLCLIKNITPEVWQQHFYNTNKSDY